LGQVPTRQSVLCEVSKSRWQLSRPLKQCAQVRSLLFIGNLPTYWLFRCASSNSTDSANVRWVQRVGEKLGVRYVMEGSVRKVGRRLLVTCQCWSKQRRAVTSGPNLRNRSVRSSRQHYGQPLQGHRACGEASREQAGSKPADVDPKPGFLRRPGKPLEHALAVIHDLSLLCLFGALRSLADRLRPANIAKLISHVGFFQAHM
jgi:hypothetical protein